MRNDLSDLLERTVRASVRGEFVCTAAWTWEDGSVTRVPVMRVGLAEWASGVKA